MIVGIQFVSIGLLGEMINHRMTERVNPVRREAGFAVPPATKTVST